jgi:integrase/recombinase XerD
MTRPNPENERIKRSYLSYLKEAGRLSETSIDQAAAAIDRFSEYNRLRNFKKFHIEQAVGFKNHLAKQLNPATGELLSKATLYATLMALRSFFAWLADKPGYRSRISFSDADYFNISEKETRIAKTRREPHVPTIEQIEYVLSMMPTSTPVQRRNRALIATAIVSGARDGALASLKLRHIDAEQGFLDQDARDVRTKFSKTIATVFFPVSEVARRVVVEWVEELRRDLNWGADDPLFPATEIEVGQMTRQFEVTGLQRQCWCTTAPIRRIFREAFVAAGLPYFNPHSFRRTLAILAQRHCRTIEEFKAWTQNLGHESAMTTLTSYGQIPIARQAELIRKMADRGKNEHESPAWLRQFLDLADEVRSQQPPNVNR